MSQNTEDATSTSRYIIGIDLGTTNCSVAFVDTAEPTWSVRDFPVPQLVAPSTVEARETLPSFHYQAAGGEFPAGAMKLPWSGDDPSTAVGAFARDHGASVPNRLISSAKSWLSHSGVDRTAALLPWHGAEDVERLSPVDVSARYLAHMRSAWDHAHQEHPASEQEVVLTVPASFDEVARELTVEAARRAGFVKLTLVEEPQAAFYAWIHSQGDQWEKQVKAGQKILVADIGGGTTDFTLIRVRPAEKGKVLFHRIAVGEHLILGGDNLDLALAHHVEQKATGGGKLSPAQWGPLVRSCQRIKETLLGEKPPKTLTISVTGGGSKLIGSSRQIELTRDEVVELLVEGFVPRVPLDARPAARRSGFQEFGLPYAPDPAITRYLAAFLSAHRDAGIDQDHVIHLDHDTARPDIVLFNGGFFASSILRQRLIETIASWFEDSPDARGKWKPKVLKNDRLDLAVSRGAAYYGMVRRGQGVRISGGLAHSYYIGVESSGFRERGARVEFPEAQPPEARADALCLLPAGIEEGQDVHLDRTFQLLIRQPVEFPLYISATRTTDAPGTLVEVDPEQLTALPPIRTVLQSGRKSAADVVSVHLHARLTEIGTLELWAAEAKGERQWRLQFDVRSATRAEVQRHGGEAEAQGFVDAAVVVPAQTLIREAFMLAAADVKAVQVPAPPTPASLVRRLELATAMSRQEWPSSLMRSFWETLIEVQEGRNRSPEHEARWLNLAGFCLRPGYGLAVDDWRIAQAWKLQPQKVQHPRNEQCRAEWWILWRRIAGGLSPGQQLTLAEPLVSAMKSRLRPAGPISQPKTSPYQYAPHETAEVWRLLGALELLKLPIKLEVAQTIVELLPREKPAAAASAALFALGRIGSRVPVYGPLNGLVEAELVQAWTEQLLAMVDRIDAGDSASGSEARTPQVLFTLVQLARRTGDRYRDVDDATRQKVLEYFQARSAPEHYVELVREGGQLAAEEQKLTFGESLPRGLRIE